MRLVFTSYVSSPEFDHPEKWLRRIEAYTGILEELAKEHEVTGIERINYEGECLQNKVRYKFIRLKRKTILFPTAMHNMIRKLEPDVVFVNGFIFPLQILQLRLRLGKKAKIIILHRAEKPFTGWKRWLQKLADRCVSFYCFASAESGDEWIQKGIISRKEKIREIMQASSVFSLSDKQASKNALGLKGRDVYLWVGRLDKNKDPETVIKAFIDFSKLNPTSELFIIYQSDELEEKLETFIRNAGVSSTIHLLGKKSRAEMQAWYNAADFIISSSHYEGSGVAVCEAMSCGCIPVLTNISSFRAMTGNGKCGWLYEAGNIPALTGLLKLSQTADKETERKKTLEQFQTELSFQAIARKINVLI